MTNGPTTAFTTRLAHLIDASALAVRDLGKKAGVAHTTITDWKLGKSLPQNFDDVISVVRVCVKTANARGAALTSNERNESAWRAAWEAAKKARHRQSPSVPDDLLEQANRQALILVTNFEIYLDRLGSLEAQLALIPDGIWPLINITARTFADGFIQEHDLQQVELPSLSREYDIADALDFLLKVAWERGYFMYMFYRFDKIPTPTRNIDDADLKSICELVMAGDPTRDIEVTLQRAVSLSTRPEQARKSLRIIDDLLVEALEEHLDDWCDTVRFEFCQGILSAMAEVTLPPAMPSRVHNP